MQASSGRRVGSWVVLIGSLCALVIGLAACGSSSSSSSTEASSTEASSTEASTTESSTSEAAAKLPPYNGPEKGVPTEFEEPKIIKGETFLVGYLSPNAGVEGLVEEEQGVKTEVEALGGKFISYDTQSNPEKQVSEFKTLLSQGVTAIVMQPANPEALAPLIAEANQQGVPVIATNTPADVPTANIPGYATDVLQGEDQCSYLNMKGIAENFPDTNFVEMGTALPYPSLEYSAERNIYWGKKFGLEFLGEEQTNEANPAEGSETMNTILTKYPEVESVTTWVDFMAVGAATTAKAAGKDVRVTGSNGEKAAVEAVENGDMYSTCKFDFAEMGKQAAIGAYSAQTKQNLPLPEKVVPTPEYIPQGNAG